MLRTLLAATLGALLASGVFAQDPKPPLYATTKVEGTDNVYVFRYQNSQAMFVVTPEGVIATDPIGQARPQAVTAYIEEIRKITQAPIRYVIYSHQHFDHIAGGKPFKDLGATFVAHRRARDRLLVLKHPEVVIPDEVVDDRGRTISLGGTTIELSYVGLNHSDNSLVMRLPKERIIFMVDTIPVGAVPGLGMIDSYPLEYEQSLKRVLAMDWERLIPGHPGQPGGRLGTRQDVEDLITFLRELSAEVKQAAEAGKCWFVAEKEITMPKYANWPGYQNLRFGIQRYCALWGRGF